MENVKNETTDRELRISRLLDAPVELVWEVWTDPDHIKNWWGPDGFTNTITKMEVVPGGEWQLTMHGPDGKNYPNRSIFREIVPHKKIMFQHFNPNFVTTVQFESRGDKTFLEWHMLFESKDEFLRVVRQHRADEGLKQNVDKLNAYLQSKKN